MRFTSILLALSMSFLFASSAFSQTTITVFDGTGLAITADPTTPQVATDASGRHHVVWAHESADAMGNQYNIFYSLLDPDGVALIAPTQLSSLTDNDDSYKPQIAVSGSNTVYVAWHTDSNGISLIGLNPAADDLNGDAAVLATIERFAEVTDFTSTDTGGGTSNHVYIDTDSIGRVHVLVQEQGSEIFCAVYDSAGSVVQALAQALSNNASHNDGTASINVRVDASNRMHIVNVADGANNNEVVYGLFDCTTSTTLIDTTILSTDDMIPSMHASMEMSGNNLYVSWIEAEGGDSSCSNSSGCNETSEVMADGINANAIHYLAIDPSSDDMNGDAASLAAITTLAETTIPLPASIIAAWYPRMGLTDAGNLRVAFMSGNDEDLYALTFGTDGTVITPATVVVDQAVTPTNGFSRTSTSKVGVAGRALVYPMGQTTTLELQASAGTPINSASSGSCGLIGIELLFVLPFVLRRRSKNVKALAA